MPKNFGQYRFRGTGTCVTNVPSEKAYKSVASNDVEETSTVFKDVSVITTASLSRDSDYYLYVKIPQGLNYDYTFNIKLVKEEEAGGSETYQFLKTVSIPRGGSAANVHTVVLYETSSGVVKAMIPLEYRSGRTNVKDSIYYDSNTGLYYLGNGNTTYTRTTKYNDISIVASWKQETGVNYGYAEMAFRPVDDGFSQIVLEMVRTAEDYSIVRDSGGTTEYGRKVEIANFDYKLYALTDLVNEINPNGKLDRIGVWGHSGLMMAVNGEEIHVGPSGVYELDVLPIETLGIVAVDYKDNFTLDWQVEQN